MAEAEKTIRLSKAIKEFNLSLDHIVDFLAKKGLKVESNPNTKLPGEAYNLLQKEFQPDKIAKEEALKITHGKLRKDTPVILDVETKAKPVSKREEDGAEILIKGRGIVGFTSDEKPKKKVQVDEKPQK